MSGGRRSETPAPPGPGRRDRLDQDDAMRSIEARVREITRENTRLFQELLANERRFRKLGRAVWRVQEDERRRIARELHDGIGQTLTALKNELERIRIRAGASVESFAASIEQAVAMAAQAVDETRELSRLLRPTVLDDLGLEPALRWLARRARERLDVAVDLDLAGLEERLDPELETLVFRVVQEALTNVSKHSGSSAARVQIQCAGRRLRILVSDSGVGFDAARVLGGNAEATGVGLRGIRDRAELFGGTLHVASGDGKGTMMEVVVPLVDDDAERSS